MNDFIDFVETDLPDGCPEMLASRVIPSFLASVRKNNLQKMSGLALRMWAVDMLIKGIRITTCRRYVGTLHNFYKKHFHSGTDIQDAFEDLKRDLSQPFDNPDPNNSVNLQMLGRLLKKSEKSSDWVTSNVILYLFYNVNASVADIVGLKFDTVGADCQQIDDLVSRMRNSPQSQYVFPLGQGKRRTPAIVRDLISSIHSTLRSIGLDFGGLFSRDRLTSLWITCALGCGISPWHIRSMVRILPSDYSFLSLLPYKPIDSCRETVIVNRVAESFNDKSVRWYVMRLRRGVTPDDIAASLTDKDRAADKELTFYYPVKKEVRKENKKLVTIETPYLPGLLFFRLRSDKVGRFMSRIGEMAWCYRVSNSPDSPYSYITCREMMAFQRYIGDFTPDIEMELVSQAPSVKIGDKVRINGEGLLNGLNGVVRAVKNIDGSVTYTLTLSDTSYIKWHDVNVKEPFVEPVTPAITPTL